MSAETAAGEVKLAEVGVQAAEALLAIDGPTVAALIRATKAYSAAGNTAKVKEFGPKAAAAAEKAVTGDKDAMGTLQVAAAALAACGEKTKAKATAEKAVGMVDAKNAGLEQQAKKHGYEPKDK